MDLPVILHLVVVRGFKKALAKLKKKIVNDEHIIDDIIKFLDTQIKENIEYDMTIENESFFYNM